MAHDNGGMGRPKKRGGEKAYRAAYDRVEKTTRFITTGEGEPDQEHIRVLYFPR